ncbi:hypothetical protein [Ovoidimarina sediminis]|uniref:hypothetical protein n=1 Tax=Ovoidimarina sediminis TaxID=3079856 RepID=UPI00290B9E09|nr:hypothetical protein [Rhodophyticola sp. MJ-SS7]MDU8945635.1 hypothetical protein [Rhodophyticola sp. MJ-SS7]
MSTEPATAAGRISRLVLGFFAAMATPVLLLPLTPWLVVWFIDGVPGIGLLFTIALILAPLPGLALSRVPGPARRKILVALALVFLALLIASALMPVSSTLLSLRSLILGTVTSSLALSILIPSLR